MWTVKKIVVLRNVSLISGLRMANACLSFMKYEKCLHVDFMDKFDVQLSVQRDKVLQ